MSSYSSLKNVIPKRKYRERSNPTYRANSKPIERHSDYVRRAKRNHLREDTINRLKVKATLKNDNEFTHGMEKARMLNGEHVRDAAVGLGTAEEQEERRRLKQRNLNMVKVHRARIARQIEQMRPTIHFMEQNTKNDQYLIATSKDDIGRVAHEHKQQQMLEQQLLGKRIILDDEEGLDDDDVKERASATKKRYQKFAELLDKQQRMDDYYLQVTRDKAQLVE